MFQTSKENSITSGHKHIDAVYHNAEWLITAFASTLVFIIFVMQVYRIPTGSMAETLRGAHFRVRCGQCGLRYDHDFISDRYGMKNTANPAKKCRLGRGRRGVQVAVIPSRSRYDPMTASILFTKTESLFRRMRGQSLRAIRFLC